MRTNRTDNYDNLLCQPLQIFLVKSKETLNPMIQHLHWLAADVARIQEPCTMVNEDCCLTKMHTALNTFSSANH
jgi:hypothetical protein